MQSPDVPNAGGWPPIDAFLQDDAAGALGRTILGEADLAAARPWLYRLADFFTFCSFFSFLGFAYSGTLLVPLSVPMVLLGLFQALTWGLRRRAPSPGRVRREFAAVLFLQATWILLFTSLVAEPIGLVVAFYNVLFVGLALLSLTPRLALFMLAETLGGLYVIRLAQSGLGLDARLAQFPINVIAATGVGMLYVLAYFSTLFLVGLVWRQQRRNAEVQRALEAGNAQLRAAERARQEFFSSVTHELRTPLVAIHGYADLIQRRDGPSAEMRVIKNSATRLQRLVDDILSLADSAQRAAQLRLEPIDPVEVARLEIAGLSLSAAEHDVDLRLSAAGDRRLQADRLRFGQIVSNLVENAIKHSPAGGVVTVEVAAGDEIVVHVDDEGTGVDPARAPHLFEPFYKGADSRGRGLGLAICRELTVAMGGRIEVGSAPGGGARFSVRFAALPAEPAAVKPAAAEARPASLRALVLDDEPDVLSLMQTALAEFGYAVDTAQNGTIALEMALSGNYDLVLLDINVPGLTGIEVSRRLAAAGKGGRVLLFSALIHADAARIVAEAQAHGFMPKPFTLETLERILADAPCIRPLGR